MTMAQSSQITQVPGPRQPAVSGGPPPAAAVGSTIDPVKLLLRYKWYLIAAVVIGAVIGTGLNYLLAATSPRWSSQVIFECKPQTQSVAELPGSGQSEEMQRFMQTQVSIIRQDRVLQRVVEDSLVLQKRAPKWSSKFVTKRADTGGEGFDTIAALKDLRKIVSASIINGTNLIQMSVTDSDKYEATELVGMVKEKYLAAILERSQSGIEDKVSQLNNQISRFDNDLKILQSRKQSVISSKGLDSVDDRQSTTKFELSQITDKLVTNSQILEAQRTTLRQLEAEYSSPGGIVYSGDLRAEAERDPQLLEIRGEIQRVETQIEARTGIITEKHREMIALHNQLDALKATRDQREKEVLKKLFEAQLDTTRKNIQQYEAVNKSLQDRGKTLQDKLVDLSKAQQDINDMQDKMRGLTESQAKAKQEMEDLISQKGSADVNRVSLVQPERVPIELSFPQLKILLPAGALLLLGLTSGVIVLIELLDTRVKSPSDVAIMPRVRLVGWVPDGGEDPAGQGAIETAFRERPRGVVAESFRQIRGVIGKRLSAGGHRTLLVASGMPQSGATSVAANLALAFASADKRVLLVDANFRRPALHRVFGLQEAPGLADVLAAKPDDRAARLAEVTQASTSPSLDLLTAGTKDQRVFERLATDAMSELLASVKAMYDIIIIDVAPVIVSGDALSLANRCDASVLVARAMADKRGMVARIKTEMGEARGEFLGIIVNAVKSSSGGYMKRNIQTAHEYQNA